MKKTREVLTEEQIREAFELFCSGEKIQDVADKYYICTRTLERMFSRRKLRKMSVTNKPNRDIMKAKK